jgi:predicted protein tyrosine phosphatase
LFFEKAKVSEPAGKTKLLFICTANINRSRAAEELFINSSKYKVQSAGFEFYRASEDRVTGQILTPELIDWADRIFVMDEIDDLHLTKLNARFNTLNKDVTVLDIPDIFDRRDPLLPATLKSKLAVCGIEI